MRQIDYRVNLMMMMVVACHTRRGGTIVFPLHKYNNILEKDIAEYSSTPPPRTYATTHIYYYIIIIIIFSKTPTTIIINDLIIQLDFH